MIRFDSIEWSPSTWIVCPLGKDAYHVHMMGKFHIKCGPQYTEFFQDNLKNCKVTVL